MDKKTPIIITEEERERAISRSRRKFLTDMESNLATAEDHGRREGRDEGRIEGRVEGRVDVARTMIANGEVVEKIMRYTGLTQEEVETLRDAD